ncbi:antitoxin Xre/MbcA/ParS toxin-binding domain-containing protein [Pseudomonas donghuensis]|uniref:antitoxin Xre/MbcA/ParS toxin-binding domain-containing protein n=1 Tax=Pseudomonas donghuensis TaxID=1163398 RepID=UPI000474C02A
MLAIDLLGPSPSGRPRCWSGQYRCFLARWDQVQSLAAYVLGNDRLADEWLIRPAIGLERRTPCSLLVDAQGYRQVCQYLMRIEYGIY